ncbi:hypothetical protein E2C01_062055 [Portunus trituberculatus]|uniref:Uncharacterized protein n=1 Tax=Portunus trituberculatus TaxID=210409 RepID=A0A5B7HDI5_PORTR|nr:hypothetical protein [Portunus trituberculatus]
MFMLILNGETLCTEGQYKGNMKYSYRNITKKVKKNIHTWYKARCTEAKKAKDKAWKKLIKQK